MVTFGLVETSPGWVLVPYDTLSVEGTRYLERRNAEILDQMDLDSRAEFLFEMYGVIVGEQ